MTLGVVKMALLYAALIGLFLPCVITRMVYPFEYLLLYDSMNHVYGSPTLNAETIVVHELTFRSFIFLFAACSYCIYRIIRLIYRKFIRYKLILPARGDDSNSTCNIYLEVTGKEDKIVLYLMTIPAKLMNITFDFKTTVTVQGYVGELTHAYLTLHWYKGIFKIHKDLPCCYPTMLMVHYLLRRRVKKLVSEQTVCRILIYDNIYYAFRPLMIVPTKDKSTDTDDLSDETAETHPIS